METSRRLLMAATVTVGLALAGCETAEDPISDDPEGLEEPADAPAGSDDGLDDAETGTGEPAVEGDSEGRLDPDTGDGE